MGKKGTRSASGRRREPIFLLLLFHHLRRFGLASYRHNAVQRCSTFVRIKRGFGYTQVEAAEDRRDFRPRHFRCNDGAPRVTIRSRATVDIQKSKAFEGKTVRRLDEFPDLVEALRDGDLLTGRLFCARLFDLDSRRSSRVREQASGKERFVRPSQE